MKVDITLEGMDDKDSSIVAAFTSRGDDANVLRVFSRATTAGYYVLGVWATRVAQQLIKSSAVVKNWGTASAPIYAVAVNEALYRELVRHTLLEGGSTVELHERLASGYTCTKRGTPGNIADFEPLLFEFNDTQLQMLACGAVSFSCTNSTTVKVGIVSLNTTLRVFCVAEFDDTPQLPHLEALVSQLNLRELIAPSFVLDKDQETCLRRLCEKANVNLSLVAKKEFAADEATVMRKLSYMLRVSEEKLLLNDLPHARGAIGALLNRAGDDEASHGAFFLRHVLPSSFVKLDMAAIQALNIIAPGQEAAKGKLPLSIFGWLNRCATGMGSRTLRQWLLQPLRDVAAVNDRLDMVQMMIETPILRDALLQQVLRRCGDMDRLNRKLQRRSISLKEVYSMLHFVQSVGTVVDLLEGYTGRSRKLVADEFLAPLQDINQHMHNLKILIDATLDSTDKSSVRIKPEFDDELQELEQQRVEVMAGIEKEHQAVMKKHSWNDKTLKCELHSSYGYVFRVSRKDDAAVRDGKTFTTVNTSKDGVRFLSKGLSALSESHRAIAKSYQQRQLSLQQKLIETVGTYLPVLDDAKELIAQLDVFVAAALVAKESRIPLVRPQVSAEEKGELSITGLRHPLIELRQQDFVVNSARMTAKTNGMIITGPNMGGKSTFMRSVGVAVVLAQAGFFVPAEVAEISLRDSIMCRVGATDHLSLGVSTFMVEMLESASILSTATCNSLVIIDELGRGTSTYDGFGLAWSIAYEVGCVLRSTVLFSTHFHEMTLLPAEHSNFVNMHFGAETSKAANGTTTLRFTYKLAPGACERSYGIYVAQLAKLPQEVIEEAQRKADELESFSSNSGFDLFLGKMESTVQDKLANYAERIRELQKMPGSGEELKLLKSTILVDPELQSYLRGQ